jgi:hypothetical protein
MKPKHALTKAQIGQILKAYDSLETYRKERARIKRLRESRKAD